MFRTKVHLYHHRVTAHIQHFKGNLLSTGISLLVLIKITPYIQVARIIIYIYIYKKTNKKTVLGNKNK